MLLILLVLLVLEMTNDHYVTELYKGGIMLLVLLVLLMLLMLTIDRSSVRISASERRQLQNQT